MPAALRGPIQLSDEWRYAELATLIEAWGLRACYARGQLLSRRKVAEAWFHEEYEPVVEVCLRPTPVVRARKLFVAGFIGSPGMNFMPATITDGTAHLPMVDVPLPREMSDRLGRRNGASKLIAGIRPEDFEDATKVDSDSRDRGFTFKARLDLVEAMGAEFSHFGIDAEQPKSAELQDLRDDAGGEETSDSGNIVLVARLSPQSRARTGEPAEFWLDATKLHFFDAESGDVLTNTP